MVTERDAYAILQVSPQADPDVIKRAYRALARLFHPDGRTPDVVRMSEINRAYEADDLLTMMRREHDRQGKPFGCSITPRQQNLAATQEFLARSATKPLRPGRSPSRPSLRMTRTGSSWLTMTGKSSGQ